MAALIPQNDSEFSQMVNAIAAKLPEYAPTLGITSEELAVVQADAQFMQAVTKAAYSAQKYAKAWTAMRNAVRSGKRGDLSVLPAPDPTDAFPPAVAPGVERRTRLLIRRIKSSFNYTDSIGKALGIVAAKSSSEVGIPKLSVSLSGSQAVLRFRRGKAHGARIFSRRGDETEFTFTAVDTRSPYVDKRPNLVPGQPEERHYYIILFVDDRLVSQRSHTVSITL